MPLIVEEDVLRLKVTMDHTRGEGEDEKVEVMDRERRKRRENGKGIRKDSLLSFLLLLLPLILFLLK